MKLYQLDNQLKLLLSTFLVVLAIGVTTGIIYVRETTNLNQTGTIENYAGSTIVNDFDIPEYFPKPFSEMLLITHNHVTAFSIIFLLLGFIFYHNSIIVNKWKTFLIIEPFLTTLVTFFSLWGIRYIATSFAVITMISGIVMYSSFYIIVFISLYELNFKK